MKYRQNLPGYLFALPALLFMVVFVGYPIVNNFILSFQDINVMTFAQPRHPWVGWETYLKVFDDPLTWTALANTAVFTVACIAVQFTVGFVLALLFQKRFPGGQVIRGLLVVTWMIPITITALDVLGHNVTNFAGGVTLSVARRMAKVMAFMVIRILAMKTSSRLDMCLTIPRMSRRYRPTESQPLHLRLPHIPSGLFYWTRPESSAKFGRHSLGDLRCEK